MHELRQRGRPARAARKITEQAAQWHLELREGPSREQRAAFASWLKASPAHLAEYLAVVQLHGDMKSATAMEPLDSDALRALAATESTVSPIHRHAPLQHLPHARVRDTAAKRPQRLRWVAAACLALAAPASLLAWLGSSRPQADPVGDVYASAANAQRLLELPDGSLIQLDRDSALSVHFDARHRDVALLRGTAMINVGKDPSRPLQVTMGATRLRDIGTVFEVKRTIDGGSVTVINGQVDLLAPAATGFLDRWRGNHAAAEPVLAVLRHGEQARVDKQGHLVGFSAHADVARTTAWLPAEIDFQQTTVAEVARRFNSYIARPLLIEDPAVAAMPISGRFHARDIHAFLAYLETFPGIRVQQEAGAIRILRRRQGSSMRSRL